VHVAMKPGRDGAPALEPFELPKNLRGEIVRTLQAAVIAGVLRPGVVYSARTLADQIGVSPTPVREAMLDLVKEGLVETVRNKGFRVTELSESELDELTEIRAMLEVPTVRRIAAAGIDPTTMEDLRALAEQIETAAKSGDLVAHNKADIEFHLKFLASAGNTSLVEIVRTLRVRSRLYGMAALAERGELTPTSHEHAELLDLVQSRDAAGAERLMRRHIGHVRGAWATGNEAS
jgi:DNA-binding GntR family transcriptional regulator